MSKIVINIKTLNINLGAGQSVSSLPLILGTLIHRAMAEAQDDQASGETTGEPVTGYAAPTGPATAGGTETEAYGDDAGAAATETKVVPILSEDHLLAFLTDDPRYTKRTFKSISAYFEDAAHSDIEDLLVQLIDEGKVKRTTRRHDHAALFESLIPTEAAPPAAESTEEAPATEEAPLELTTTNVRSFLGSDPRYTKRSLDAITKHFGVGVSQADDGELEHLLSVMVDDGDIETKTRRADGATLYQLA